MNNEEKYDELIKAGIKEYHDNEIESVMAAPQQIEASEEFKKNMEQFINGMGNSADGSTETNTDGNPVNNPHNNVPKKAGSHKMIKRIACVAVILIAGAAVIGIANKDVGARYMDFFREYLLGGFTEYKGTDKDANKTDGEFELTYIPEGFELSEVTFEHDKKKGGSYMYINDNKLILFRYTTSGTSLFQLDNENLEHSYLVLDNGIKGDYYKHAEGDDKSMLVWKQDGYMCWITISGTDEKWAEKELLNVANGVREVSE